MVDFTLLTSALAGYISVAILIAIGILLIIKYQKYKYPPLIWWGLSTIFLTTTYLHAPINSTLIFLEHAPLTASQVSLFYTIGPLTLVAWITAWSEILYKDNIKLIRVIVIMFAAFLYIAFFMFFFIDMGMLMTFNPPNTYIPGPWILINGILMLMIFMLTAIKLWANGRKSEDKEIRIKGLLFLIQALILFMGIVINLIAGNIFLEVLGYALIIIAGILLYISQAWPEWAKKIFVRNI